MTPVGFEPTISAGVRPQAYALDRAATGTGYICKYKIEQVIQRCKLEHDYDGSLRYWAVM